MALIVGSFVSAPSVSWGSQAEPKRYAGRAVVDVLGELQAMKLKLIFSTEVVPPSLRIATEPRGTDPRSIALQILEPHGLTLQQGPGGTLLVVAAVRPPKPEIRKPAPPKRDATEREPAPVQPLRIAEHVEVTHRSGDAGASSRVYSIEPEAVQEMAGGLENVLQAVQVLPGVVGTNDEEGKLAVRGGGPEHNLIVLDGVQIHNAQRFGEFTTSFMNPATAASVTLDSSGLDARYGGRLSSVVNLETRDGTTERAFAASGALGLTSGDVLVEGRMPGTTTGSWWATVRGTYYRLVADRFDDGAMPSFGDLQFKTTVYPTKRTRLTFFGLAGREMLEEAQQTEPGEAALTTARNRGDNRIAAATLRWMPSSRFSSATTVSAYSTASRYEDLQQSFFSDLDAFDRSIGVRDVAVRQELLYASAKGFMIDAGADLHRVRTSWKMKGVKQPEWWRGIGPSTWGELVEYSAGPIDSRLERTQAGAWLQVRFAPGGLVTIEPGIRVDWNSFTGETAVQPRLRVARAFGRTSVWAGFSTQAQTPSHESLQGFDYLDFSDASTTELRNERSRQIVAGFERPIGQGFSVRVEAYRRTLDRLLVQRQETEAERHNRLRDYVLPPDLPPDAVELEYRPTIFPENTGKGRAAGVEVLLRREGRRVSGWLGYTLSKATRDLYGRTVPFDFDRTHAMNAVIDVPLTARLRAAATLQIASGFPTTPVRAEVLFGRLINLTDGTRDPLYRASRNAKGELVSHLTVFQRRLASINTERLSGYSRADFRVTYATGGHWEFYGEVLNAFNHRNYVQTISDPTISGEAPVIGRSNIYNTFERMGSFGMRVKF
jgi:hypothetical protein